MPYGTLIGLWPYALLKQLFEHRIRTGEWEIDWTIHSTGVVCAVAGIAVAPLVYFVGWWAGSVAFAVYVFPLVVVVAVICVIVYLDRVNSAELEYDAGWCTTEDMPIGTDFDPAFHQNRSERQVSSTAITGSISGIAVILLIFALIVAGFISRYK